MSLRTVIALTLFLFLFAVPNTMLSSTVGLKNDADTNKDPSLPLQTPIPSYEPFNGSISIESDPEFTIENGVSSGSGTQSDPYIIENLSFEVGTVPAIKIANTKAHLIIRNITVTGGQGLDLSSISLNDCKNIIIFGIEVSDGGTGIDIRRTSNILVDKCRFLTCNTGVFADDVTELGFFNSTMVSCKTAGSRLLGPSFNVSVSWNEAVSNDKDGMIFEGVFIGLNVTSNNASINGNYGIRCIDVDGKMIIVSENTFSENLGFGAYLEHCQTMDLHNNIISDNPSGGILGEGLSGIGVNISENTVMNNGIYGMELQGVSSIKIGRNLVLNQENYGIYLGSGSKENHIHNNLISSNEISGIMIGNECNNNIINHNELKNNYAGLVIIESINNRIENNSIHNNIRWGTYQLHSQSNIYNCNYIMQNGDFGIASDFTGINSFELEGSVYSGNFFKGNIKGDMMIGDYSLKNIIVENSFISEGVSLYLLSSSSVVSSNIFNGNNNAIQTYRVYDTTIFNNFFNNSNCLIDNFSKSSVIWSLTEKTYGKNILGGPYRFGNYWSDYNGEDINGDGIGDTKLPHGPGDIGPLVMDYPPPDTEPPTIFMTNFDVPVTGEVWTGRFKVHDNRSMFGVKVHSASCIQQDVHGNVVEEWTEKDVGFDDEGRFSIKLDVQPSTVDLSVNISAMDFSGNIVNISSHLDVEDPILPEVLGMEYPSEVNAGDELDLTMDLFDNVGIGSVEAIFDLGKTIAPLNASGVPLNEHATKWSVSIDVPEEALETVIDVIVSDISGNEKVVQITDITVKDSLPPFLEDRTVGRPRTGGPFDMTFIVKDNHAVSSMVLLTSQDGIDGAPIWGEGPLSGPTWVVQVPIKTTTRELTFTLKVEDRSGNEQVLRGSYLVMDTIGPVIERIDTNEPLTGEPFELRFMISDNWGTFHGELEWWFDDGQAYRMELPSERTMVPQVPISAKELHYVVHIEDENANAAEFDQVLQIRDIIPPALSVGFSGPRTSSQWLVHLSSSDNWGMGQIWFNRSFDGGPIVANDHTGGPDNITIQIEVPEDALRVNLDCSVRDVTGLINSFKRTIDIADGTPPVIIGHTMRKVTGGNHEFTVTGRDNRELYKAWLILRDGVGNEKKVLMKEMGDGRYVHSLVSERLKGYRNYSVIIEDGSGLTASTGSLDLDVQDQGSNELWTIIIFIFLLVLISLLLLAVFIFNRWVCGEGRTYGRSPVWLSRGTGDVTRPREVTLPPKADEE